jgi:hypothetical protein
MVQWKEGHTGGKLDVGEKGQVIVKTSSSSATSNLMLQERNNDLELLKEQNRKIEQVR